MNRREESHLRAEERSRERKEREREIERVRISK